MNSFDTNEYLDFVSSHFSLGKINEAQTNFLLSQTDNQDRLAGLERIGLRQEFLSHKSRAIMSEQDDMHQRAVLDDQIMDLEKLLKQEEEKMKPIQDKMKPFLIEHENTYKRLQQYPDNPHLQTNLDKISNDIKDFNDTILPIQNKIKELEAEITNLKTIKDLM